MKNLNELIGNVAAVSATNYYCDIFGDGSATYTLQVSEPDLKVSYEGLTKYDSDDDYDDWRHRLNCMSNLMDTLFTKNITKIDDSYIERVDFNAEKRVTAIKWVDGTVTKVTAREQDKYDPYYGFCVAATKKMFGNTSKFNDIINEHIKKEALRNAKKIKKQRKKDAKIAENTMNESGEN